MKLRHVALALFVSLIVVLSACRNSDSTTTDNHVLLVANIYNNSITSYRESDNGNIAPLRTLSCATTPIAVAVNAKNNEILSVNADASVAVYARNASGDTTLTRTITGDTTMLHGPNNIAVDNLNSEIIITNSSIVYSSNTVTYYHITVYADDAYGNAAPIRTISGDATELNAPTSVAVDAVHNEFYVANYGTNSITVYNRADTGNVAPLRTIVGNNTGLSNPHGITVDTSNNEILVANFDSNSITVYSRGSYGDSPPIRTISGNVTGLNAPTGIAVNTLSNEISVANLRDNSITVYSRAASGNVTPLRVISGGNTNISGPSSIAFASE